MEEYETLHVFYLIKNVTGEIMDPPVIYAITDKKELAKTFKENRNMDIFYYKKIKLTHLDLIRELDRLNQYMLTSTSFLTQIEEGISHVNVIVTWKEESELLLSSQDIFIRMIIPTLIDSEIFSDEIYNFLKDVDYHKLERIKEEREYQLPVAEMEELTLMYDELNMFIKTYGWTMKGIEKNEKI